MLIRYTGLQTSKAGRVFKRFEVFVAGAETEEPIHTALALVRREEG